jgi:hypothetical protein
MDAFVRGEEDDAVLEQMSAGTLAISGGALSIFATRLSKVLESRLLACSERMRRDMGRSHSEVEIVRSVTNARSGLAKLHRLGAVPALPETLRRHIQDEVRKFAERAQSSLENSARQDRSGRIAHILRSTSLANYATTAPPSASPRQVSAPDSAPRRRNILT